MLIAIKYLRPLPRGVTRPLLILADDGRHYVVKLQSNRLGKRILVNEFLAKKIGEKLGLCFPASDLIYLSPEIKALLNQQQDKNVESGPHFASAFLNKAHYVTPQNLRQAVNHKEMAGVMFFDHLFHNFDRTHNRRNLLIQSGAQGARIYAIDHSHLFYRGRWQILTLQKQQEQIAVNSSRIYGVLLRRFLEREDFLVYQQRFAALSDQDFCRIVTAIPEEWQVSTEERQALAVYLIRRRNLAEQIIAALSRLIPDRHRSAEDREGK